MSTKFDELPNKKSKEFPEQITVKLSLEAKAKLTALDNLGKDPSGVVRQAIDKHLADMPELKDVAV